MWRLNALRCEILVITLAEGGETRMPQWVEISLRTLISVVVLFLLTKMLGKRQVSQLSFFEYITGITIGSLAAYISLDLERNWYLGLIALAVWVLFSLGIEFIQIKSKRLRDFIDFKATVLIQGGRILEGNLKKERLSSDELIEQLRKKGVFNIADVEYAVMESSGEVNVMLVSGLQPLTPRDIKLETTPQNEPFMVIMDGEVMDKALKQSGKEEGWLRRELERLQLKPEDVYLGQIDSFGRLALDLYDDKVSLPQIRQRAQLYANLKKCHADLEMFSYGAPTEEIKEMYDLSAAQLVDLLEKMKPVLRQNN